MTSTTRRKVFSWDYIEIDRRHVWHSMMTCAPLTLLTLKGLSIDVRYVNKDNPDVTVLVGEPQLISIPIYMHID